MDAALDAMGAMGFEEAMVKATVQELLKVRLLYVSLLVPLVLLLLLYVKACCLSQLLDDFILYV